MITFIFFTSITSIMENGFRKIVLIKLMSREFHIFLKKEMMMMNISPFGVVSVIFHFLYTPNGRCPLRLTFFTPSGGQCGHAFMSSPHPPLLSEPLGTLVNCLLPHCQEKAAICIISCTYSVRQTKPCYNLRFNLPWTLQRGKRPRCGGKYSLEECPRKDKGTWVRTRLMSEILF